MENFNNHGPCLEKNCSWCCDPVKIDAKKIINGMELPKDRNGNDLWKKRDETFVSESQPDTSKIFTYDCNNLDKETGECLDYENRPDICRNLTCIDPALNSTDDKQHKEITEQKFIK